MDRARRNRSWLAVLAVLMSQLGCRGQAVPRVTSPDAGARQSLEDAWLGLQAAVKADDPDSVWSLLSRESRRWALERTGASQGDGARAAVNAAVRARRADVVGGRRIDGDERGSTAVIVIESQAGIRHRIAMVWEDGGWKLDLPTTKRIQPPGTTLW